MEGDAVGGTVYCINRDEVVQALNETGKASGLSDVSLELIAASR